MNLQLVDHDSHGMEGHRLLLEDAGGTLYLLAVDWQS